MATASIEWRSVAARWQPSGGQVAASQAAAKRPDGGQPQGSQVATGGKEEARLQPAKMWPGGQTVVMRPQPKTGQTAARRGLSETAAKRRPSGRRPKGAQATASQEAAR